MKLLKILFYGELGAGKTTLAHALASHAGKQGVAALEFNLDATAHSLKQQPFFDVRKTELGREASEEKNPDRAAEKVFCKQLLEDKAVRNALAQAEREGAKLALFDSNASPSFFLSASVREFTSGFFDRLVLVSDAGFMKEGDENFEFVKALGGFASAATGLPLTVVLNKIDLACRKEEKQKTLSGGEGERKPLKKRMNSLNALARNVALTRASGWERIGLNELLDALETQAP
ncbi:ATP/GTP-binding protein [Candidatus Micrarchaeota archaeon]|nr:ATP/GTP-binding protein [Candidatus Micrarchaeota archaeon]